MTSDDADSKRALLPRAAAPSGAPGRTSMSLGRLFDVEVRVDWSLLIIFALVTVSLGSAVFPAWHPDWSPLVVWSIALGAAILFFASVLAHEMSHALVARTQDVPVRRITLFVFGGMAHMEREPQSPKAEFLIAIVGPLASLVIGVGAWFVGSLLAAPTLSSAAALQDPAHAMAQVGPAATLLLWLGPVNVVLAVFNLVPGFPLDGGRVLRSFLWWRTGDLVKATRWAAGAGQLVGFGLMALGAWNLLGGNLGNGLWLLLIGWFLNNAARVSYEQLIMRHALRGVALREIMLSRLEPVPPDITARRLVEEHIMVSDQRAFPVESPAGFLGLICIDDVRRLPRERWDDTTAAQLMTPVAALVTLPPHAEAAQALSLMTRRDVEQIPVLDDGGPLLGLVRRRDILKWLALRQPDHAIGRSDLASGAA